MATEITARLSFAIFDPKNGHRTINEGETAVIDDDAEAKRLESAGILQIVGVVKVVSKPAPTIETADLNTLDVETADKKIKAKK